MKRAIVSAISEDSWQEIASLTWPRMSEYATRHNAEFVPMTLPRHKSRPAPWLKLPAIAGALAKNDEVLWLDADVLIVDESKSIFDELADGKDHAMCWVTDEAGTWHFNTGVWACRRGVLPAIVMAAMEDDLIHHPWWEQAAVLRHVDMLQHSVLDECWNYWRGSPKEIAPRFRHACGIHNHQERVATIRSWM